MQEFRAKLRAAKLTDRQLACLSLHYFDGMTYEAIAEQMGIAKQTVCQHIRYGLRKLETLGMVPSRTEFDETPKLKTMEPSRLDSLGPADIAAVW